MKLNWIRTFCLTFKIHLFSFGFHLCSLLHTFANALPRLRRNTDPAPLQPNDQRTTTTWVSHILNLTRPFRLGSKVKFKISCKAGPLYALGMYSRWRGARSARLKTAVHEFVVSLFLLVLSFSLNFDKNATYNLIFSTFEIMLCGNNITSWHISYVPHLPTPRLISFYICCF